MGEGRVGFGQHGTWHALHELSIYRHAIALQVTCKLLAADAAALLQYSCRRTHSMYSSGFGRSIHDVFLINNVWPPSL